MKPLHPMAKSAALAGAMSAALLVAAGCGKKSLESEFGSHQASSESRPAPSEAVVVKGVIEFSQPREYFKGVGVRATAAGNAVTVSIHNMKDTPLFIVPKQFAIIVEGKAYPAVPGTADLRLFPPTQLEPNGTMAGVIAFSRFENLAGRRLVYNNPDLGEKFFVVIEGAASQSPPAP